MLVGGDSNGNSGVVRTINPVTTNPNPYVIWTQFGTDLPHADVSTYITTLARTCCS